MDSAVDRNVIANCHAKLGIVARRIQIKKLLLESERPPRSLSFCNWSLRSCRSALHVARINRFASLLCCSKITGSPWPIIGGTAKTKLATWKTLSKPRRLSRERLRPSEVQDAKPADITTAYVLSRPGGEIRAINKLDRMGPAQNAFTCNKARLALIVKTFLH